MPFGACAAPAVRSPTVIEDLAVLSAGVLIGLLPLAGLDVARLGAHRQLRRVRTSASTPPG